MFPIAPRGITGARDEVTLAQVKHFKLNLVLECLCCGHKRLMDVEALLLRLPPQTTMQQLQKRARCSFRGCRGGHGAEALFRTGERSDDWWPRLPAHRRC